MTFGSTLAVWRLLARVPDASDFMTSLTPKFHDVAHPKSAGSRDKAPAHTKSMESCAATLVGSW